MSGLTYVITGANRGIGKGLLQTLVLRPGTTIIAAVRDIPSSKQILTSVPVGEGSKIILVKIDSKSATDAGDAVEHLKSKYGITKIDVLVSNAGLQDSIVPVLKTTVDSIREHLEVNTIAPFVQIKAFLPLLEASSNPKFIVISGSFGSIKLLEEHKVPIFAYGLSKAAVNYFVRKLSFENTNLITVAIHPGWVLTEMGYATAKGIGMEVGMKDGPVPMEAMSVEECIKCLITQFDTVSKEESGAFLDPNGQAIPW